MTYARNATGPLYQGTRAALAADDWLTPGHASNDADRELSWVDFSGALDAAIRGCELAREGVARHAMVRRKWSLKDLAK